MREKYKIPQGGFSLVELLVTVALVAIILAVVMPQYISLLRHSTVTRKTAKTDIEVVSNLEQFFKDIHTAGYGLPNSSKNLNAVQCTRLNGISIGNSSVTIRSPAAGDKVHAGKWAIVSGDGMSLPLPTNPLNVINNIPQDNYVMILDTAQSNPETLGVFRIGSNRSLTYVGSSVATRDKLASKIAYWIPTSSSSSIAECYETTYSLQNYTTQNPIPNMCASTTRVLRRSKNPADVSNESPQPILDCVKTFVARIGCLSSQLTWRQSECETGEIPKLLRVGIVYQIGPREKTGVYPYSNILLFGDLGSTLSENINFSEDERYYRWAVLEKTLYLPNME
ncbi:MAG: prepilin-type N-terminal cleavage/methylation domain-containing protein [Syntrophobacterales bacterium]|nr:prepilin-type N-terminal cleavage/methylation domain-containing protein [Syntrophobacterales bacterium]